MPAERASPVATYDFTLRKDEDIDYLDVIKALCPLAKKWVFQLETGNTGYVHWQGRMSLFKKRRKHELIDILPDIFKQMCLSPSSNNSLQGDCFYMVKDDTRTAGPWSDKDDKPKYIPRQYRGLMENLYPWQKTVLDSKDIFDPRTVNFVYDPRGNNGKSTVAALMELHTGGLDLPPIGDHKELLQVVCDVLMAREERDPRLVFVDLPRSLDSKKLAPFMVAIEQIKKGHVADVRHHYKDWWFDSPQVWVFANWKPDLSYLSQDRWKFHTIDAFKNLRTISKKDLEEMEIVTGSSGSSVGNNK